MSNQDKNRRIKELWSKLQNEKFSPVIAFPGSSQNKWKMEILSGNHLRHITLQDEAEFIIATKEWKAIVLLPKNSIIETNIINSKFVIDFKSVHPLDVVIDETPSLSDKS